jgi:hypothetical protein
MLLLLSGCVTVHQSEDFARHTHSQLSSPLDQGDYFWFDVETTPELPDQSEAAEARRMEWLGAWLATRKLCTAGYEIDERRSFEFLEHNPARYDLRYKVRCKVPPQV